MSVQESLRQLRQRFFLVKGLRQLREVAREIPITRDILRDWLNEDADMTEKSILRVEQWVEKEEERRGTP